jgi:uncharacterized CHY-type Zn-finger protein
MSFLMIGYRNDPPHRLFFRQPDPVDYASVADQPHENTEERDEEEHLLICRYCRNIITSPKERIEIEGRMSIAFTNPAGIVYRIGCFSSARGCVSCGVPTEEFTWFKGYRWDVALCSVCMNHLGWRYQGKERQFFGLVLDYLIDNR